MSDQERAENLGCPIINIRIELQYSKRQFSGGILSALAYLEAEKAARYWAKSLIEGEWFVTERGYLVRGRKRGLTSHRVYLYIRENIVWLIALGEVSYKGERIENQGLFYGCLYDQDGKIEYIGFDQIGLYLKSIKERYQNKNINENKGLF